MGSTHKLEEQGGDSGLDIHHLIDSMQHVLFYFVPICHLLLSGGSLVLGALKHP